MYKSVLEKIISHIEDILNKYMYLNKRNRNAISIFTQGLFFKDRCVLLEKKHNKASEAFRCLAGIWGIKGREGGLNYINNIHSNFVNLNDSLDAIRGKIPPSRLEAILFAIEKVICLLQQIFNIEHFEEGLPSDFEQPLFLLYVEFILILEFNLMLFSYDKAVESKKSPFYMEYRINESDYNSLLYFQTDQKKMLPIVFNMLKCQEHEVAVNILNDVFSLKRYPDKGCHDNRFSEDLSRLKVSIPYLRCNTPDSEYFERISAARLQFENFNTYDNESICADAGDSDDPPATKTRKMSLDLQ